MRGERPDCQGRSPEKGQEKACEAAKWKDQVLEAMRSGLLWWDEKAWGDGELDRNTRRSKRPGYNMARLRNFGWQSWAILNDWLGLGSFEEMMTQRRP